MSDLRTFMNYVIPSVLSFALSGVYAIVDGFFVGNTMGDIGLSAINVAYPITAVILAVGTGIGMGGAVQYSISSAQNKPKKAMNFVNGTLWLLIVSSIIITLSAGLFPKFFVSLLGAKGTLLEMGTIYIRVIALGAFLQIGSTGLVPMIRNYGGAFFSMVAMISGFVTNIILDYLLVWVLNLGMTGAGLATILGEGLTFLLALIYLLKKSSISLKIPLSIIRNISGPVIKVGIAPFGMSLAPNISLVIINWFSIKYGGDRAVATYACISYVICVIYLILQGVGDGSQPLMSRYYGAKNLHKLKITRDMAYVFSLILALLGCFATFYAKGAIGALFGTSASVNAEIEKIIPIFLVSVPFVSISRIATASFYATEKTAFSYVLTFIEPVLMLILMLILPPLFGGQIMVWWSSVFARIISAILAYALKIVVEKSEKTQLS